MNVLALDDGGMCLRVRGIGHDLLVTVLLGLGSQSPFGVIMVPMIDASVLDRTKIVMVLFWKYLLVMDRLNGVVVVVLVHFLVDGCVDFLMLMRLHRLVHDRWGDIVMGCGVVVTRLAHKVADSCFCLVHLVCCMCLRLVRLC